MKPGRRISKICLYKDDLFVEEYTVEEIAEMFGLAASTVKEKLRKGANRLDEHHMMSRRYADRYSNVDYYGISEVDMMKRCDEVCKMLRSTGLDFSKVRFVSEVKNGTN